MAEGNISNDVSREISPRSQIQSHPKLAPITKNRNGGDEAKDAKKKIRAGGGGYYFFNKF